MFELYPSVLDVAQTQMELGFAHWRQQNHQQAIAAYKLCEPVFVTIGNRLALSTNYYGLAYTGLHDFEAASRCFAQSLELVRELNILRALAANVLESLGRMYEAQGLHDMAIAIWEQGLATLAALAEPPEFLRNLLLRRIEEAGCSPRGIPHGFPLSSSAPNQPVGFVPPSAICMPGCGRCGERRYTHHGQQRCPPDGQPAPASRLSQMARVEDVILARIRFASLAKEGSSSVGIPAPFITAHACLPNEQVSVGHL